MKYIIAFCLIIIGQIVVGKPEDTLLLNKVSRLESEIRQTKKTLDALHFRNDSLQNSLNEIKINDYKSFEVIDSVNNYYDNAWSKLIFLISSLGGIIVFVIPIILSRLQRRELRLNKEDFQEYVDKKIIEFEKTIKEHNDIKISEFSKEIEKNQKVEITKLYGMTYYLQGQEFYFRKNYHIALNSFIQSLKKQIETQTEKNINVTLGQILNSITEIKKVDKKLGEDVKKQVEKVINLVESKFETDYSEIIKKIKATYYQ